MTIYNDVHVTHDADAVAFDTDTAGVSTDSDGQTHINWDEIEKVRVDEAPYSEAFDTKFFYEIPATVAKPIRQTYVINDEEYTFVKPREELKKALWSLDNAPYTLEHPSTALVRSVDDVHGFWRNPKYIDSLDDADANLMIPTNDKAVRQFIDKHGLDVSVGFTNRIRAQYDGVVAKNDSFDDVDGYQTDMLFNHVASVKQGRCSGAQGCGLDNQMKALNDGAAYTTGDWVKTANGVGQIDAVGKETYTVSLYDEGFTNKGNYTVDAIEPTECPVTQTIAPLHDTADGYLHVNGEFIKPSEITHDYRDEDGVYFAVAPDETEDGVPKYPITSCTGEDSVESAWHLRHHGDINISVADLEERIRRRASQLECDIELETTDTMTDNGTDGGDGFSTSDLTLEAIAAQHDGVNDVLSEKRSLENTIDDVVEAVDADDIDEVTERIDTLLDEYNELKETIDEYEAEQKAELADEIVEHTDRWGDKDDLMSESLDSLEEYADIVDEFIDENETVTANADRSSADKINSGKPRRKTPWDN